jgi:hypothetical protein
MKVKIKTVKNDMFYMDLEPSQTVRAVAPVLPIRSHPGRTKRSALTRMISHHLVEIG